MRKKKNLIKGKPLHVNAGVMIWYRRQTGAIQSELRKRVVRAILDNYRKGMKIIAADAEPPFIPDPNYPDVMELIKSSISMIESDIDSVDFEKRITNLAVSFVKKVDKSSKASFGASISAINSEFSIQNSLASPEMQAVLKATIEENVRLIKSQSHDFIDSLTGDVYRSIQGNFGLKKLARIIQKKVTSDRLRSSRIAEDQTRKAYNAINLQNMKSVGIEKFEWLHSGGSAYPRAYHKTHFKNGGLNHGIFLISEPPVIDQRSGERGFPAQLPNCKCVMIPVIEL